MSQKTAVQLKEQLGAVDLLEWQRDVADSAWLRADLPDATTDEMEAGTETDPRAMSPADVAAAIAALGGRQSGVFGVCGTVDANRNKCAGSNRSREHTRWNSRFCSFRRGHLYHDTNRRMG